MHQANIALQSRRSKQNLRNGLPLVYVTFNNTVENGGFASVYMHIANNALAQTGVAKPRASTSSLLRRGPNKEKCGGERGLAGLAAEDQLVG
jgi:hypothetical protein